MERTSSSRVDRCVVNVATGPHYLRGQRRLLGKLATDDVACIFWNDRLPDGSPTHEAVPYGFKAYAFKEAARHCPVLLWADASIVPAKTLDPIWTHAEEYGVWLSRNGYWNAQWTALAAYPDLQITREENEFIPHVVATAFAIDTRHPRGQVFLSEYFRLASQTRAFCGPWVGGAGVQHRHDQTAASVIAWRLGIPLTEPPALFAYQGGETDDTVLIADGAY